MPISNITNGEAGSDVRTSLNQAIDFINSITPAGTALNTAADALAQAALIGSLGGNYISDSGKAALFSSDGELLATSLMTVRSTNYAAIIVGSDGWGAIRSVVDANASIQADYYASGAPITGSLLFPSTLSGGVNWLLPDDGGTLMLTSAIGNTVQANSATLTTLAGKSLSGTGNLACVAGAAITGLTNLGVSMAANSAMTGFALGSISDTTSRPFNITQTLNNAGLTATLLKVSATVTSAVAASKLVDLCAGSGGTTSVFSVDTVGNLTLASAATGDATIYLGKTTSGFTPLIKSLFSSNAFTLGFGSYYGIYIAQNNLVWVNAVGGGEFRVGNGMTISDAGHIVLGATTGTKIGTATGQKLGFWNATPVVQQVLATGGGATVDNVISLLQTLGLCKQS